MLYDMILAEILQLSHQKFKQKWMVLDCITWTDFEKVLATYGLVMEAVESRGTICLTIYAKCLFAWKGKLNLQWFTMFQLTNLVAVIFQNSGVSIDI